MKGNKLSKKDVAHIANLSNLKLTEEEIDKFTPQLSKIVEYINILNEVDTTNTKPTYQVTGLKNVFHEDKVDVTSSLTESEALLNTDNTYNGLFKVKAILENRTNN